MIRKHSHATNNAAFTGKFDVTTIELSAGQLQPPLNSSKSIVNNTTTQNKQLIMSADALFGQGIFEDLQRKIDEETAVKDVCGDRRPRTLNGRAKQTNNGYRLSVRLSRHWRSRVSATQPENILKLKMKLN